MIKSNTLNFEQIKPQFHKWAKFFCNKNFEYWELINSAWLYGKVRFLPQSKIKLASKRIKYDMMDYMRDISLSRRIAIRLSKGKTFPFINNFSEMTPQIEGGDGFETTLKVKDDVNSEQKDLMNFLTNHPSLSRTEKLIMKSMYLGGCNKTETAKALGLHPTRVNQIHSNLMARFRSFDYSKVI